MARKLKVLSLKSCNNITQTPNFSECLNLERLTLECCSQLRKIDSSIGKLKCLTELRIGSCGCLEDLPNQIGDLVKLKLLSILWCKVKKLPESIWKLRSLLEVHFEGDFDGLPSAIGLLQNLKVLQVSSRYLKDLPNTIHMLPHLRRLKLMRCDKIQELPVLPTSLTHLIVSSRSLHYVSNLRNLTNLVELDLDVRGRAYGNHLWWIENLSKLTNLRLRLCNVRISTELVFLPLLKKLDLHGLDVQTVLQLPLSLQYLALHDANSTESLSLIPINLSPLKLRRSPWQDLVPQMKRTPLQELTLSVVRVLRAGNLDVRCHVNLERLRPSGMRKLKEVLVSCPKLVEIQCPLVFESLEVLFIEGCESLGSLTYLREAGHNDNGYATDLTNCEGRLILPLRALNKLRRFTLGRCPKILEIQIVGMSESWEYFSLFECPYVQSLDGLSNLKKLKDLNIKDNERLQVVKGLDELEFLDNLQVHGCGLLESLIDVSSTKLSNYCHIHTSGCRREDFRGYLEYYKHHNEQESRFKQEQEQESHFKHKQD
ncbi:disease resistance protein RPV1-like isoform X1 [Eucalyptus grandis]|uniref:disease resistance protein RPV1-like isoform X1 n=1 Tax=Eucalyptus grandis TaxID=71139 RepID=UPI00192F09E5|nr:disease resistance protein RPV1-like isoform X1 [Eucalyptus grandis]XP_039162108.1 disease resistance protein RPV1-like isoform X1 [Eucalyptus grandis]